jgi:hypothetical protein
MTKINKYFLLLLALSTQLSIRAMDKQHIKGEDSSESDEISREVIPKNFTELPQELQYIILEFVCEPSKQPYIAAINIGIGHRNYALVNKNCNSAVDFKLSSKSFSGKLYQTLKKHCIKAVEHKGINLLREIAHSHKEDAEVILDKLPVEDVPYTITAIALSKLMGDTKSKPLLIDSIKSIKDIGKTNYITIIYLGYKYKKIKNISRQSVRYMKGKQKLLYLKEREKDPICSVPFVKDYRPLFDLLPYTPGGKISHKDFFELCFAKGAMAAYSTNIEIESQELIRKTTAMKKYEKYVYDTSRKNILKNILSVIFLSSDLSIEDIGVILYKTLGLYIYHPYLCCGCFKK